MIGRKKEVWLLFLLLLVRQWNRLAHPMVWAEDGVVYLQEAYRDGLASFIHPSSGYFHGIQRLVAYSISLIPPTWVPFHWLVILNCVVATLIFAACAGFFVDDGFSSLVRSRKTRFFVALCIGMAPGLDEILGNLANLHSVCALFLFLLVIRSRVRDLTRAEGAFAFLSILTSGEGVVLVPLFAYRWWRFRRKDDLWILGALALSAALVLGSALGMGAGRAGALAERDPLSLVLAQTLQGWIFGLGNWIEIFPWAGYRLTSNLGTYAPALWWILWLGGLGWVARSLKQEPERRFEWLLWGAYFLQIVFLTIYVRGRWGASLIWKHPIRPWPELGRYGFILAPYAILFWVLVLGRARTALRVFLFVYLAQGLFGGFFLPDFEVLNPDWPATSRTIAEAYRTGCPRELRISSAPKEWRFTLTMPDRGQTCP